MKKNSYATLLFWGENDELPNGTAHVLLGQLS